MQSLEPQVTKMLLPDFMLKDYVLVGENLKVRALLVEKLQPFYNDFYDAVISMFTC